MGPLAWIVCGVIVGWKAPSYGSVLLLAPAAALICATIAAIRGVPPEDAREYETSGRGVPTRVEVVVFEAIWATIVVTVIGLAVGALT